MPCLAPSLSLPETFYKASESSKEQLKLNLKPLDVVSNGEESHGSESKVPVVQLDVDMITDVVAARLATSLLGHVLFLKNQVPFPVMQLGRLPGGKSNSKAAKQRAELLASFDTLASHLNTTFTALSTAFALCSKGQAPSDPKTASCVSVPSSSECAYLAILVGPSLGSAKSKVFLALDRLEARVWGQRHDGNENITSNGDDDDTDDEDKEDDDDDEEGDDDDNSDGEEVADSEEEEYEEASDSSEDEDESHDQIIEPRKLKTPPPPYVSHAEEQRFLQNAERLLSRTLATADADGNSLGSEMSPTQTHILLRAPRRFVHPAWVPRQALTSGMDASLGDFLIESCIGVQDKAPARKANKKGKPQGVWIKSRTSATVASPSNKQADTPEEDELIWWSWDGKLVGFADW